MSGVGEDLRAQGGEGQRGMSETEENWWSHRQTH